MNRVLKKSLLECTTPLADALLLLKSSTQYSFHALPISCGASLNNSWVQEKYEELFGKEFLQAEMTVTGKSFDSFFFAKYVIKEAEQLAASLFGADGTLFVTSGTTVSNQIAIDALYQRNCRVLLDKNCHQSMHFMLRTLTASIDYLVAISECGNSGRNYWSIEELLATALRAQQEGDGYQLIILNAHSYDGVLYDIPSVIRFLIENGVSTRHFLIDEAWGSANYFNTQIKNYTALNIQSLIDQFPDLNVVATHSAHKSLSCLRQASMIHYRGQQNLGEKLRLSRFRIHTTSPSYPILASLDLARAQMQTEGMEFTHKVTKLAAEFSSKIKTDPMLSCFRINTFSIICQPIAYAHADPTKVSLNVEELGITAREIKEILYTQHGIYINRNTDNSLLLNFHIGVNEQAVEKLLTALRAIQATPHDWPSTSRNNSYVIPYPPGVPLVVPGEPITPKIRIKIREYQRSGINVFYA